MSKLIHVQSSQVMTQLIILAYLQISQRLKDLINSSADSEISLSEYILSTSGHHESLFVSTVMM